MFQLVLIALFLGGGYSTAPNCNETVNPTDYKAFPSVYNSALVINPGVDGCDTHRGGTEFQCDYNVVLGDGVMVPSPPDLTSSAYLRHFIGWQRGNVQSYVDFDLTGEMVTAIELSFLNSPANGISIPDIQLSIVFDYGATFETDLTSPVSSAMIDNQDLAQTDNQVRSVTLLATIIIIGPQSTNLRIGFQFTEFHDFDWILLSEVRFCTDSQPAFQPVITFQPLPSSIVQPSADELKNRSTELVCTVSSEGEYSWQWERNNSTIENTDANYDITVGDGSRTTRLTISNLNFSDAGRYECTANVSGMEYSESIVHIVQFPEIITAPDVMRGYLETGEVTLSCELHGYQSTLSPPVWLFMNGSEITTSDKYTITSGQGTTNTIVLENGTVLPSETVSLRISTLTSADEGNFTCLGPRGSETVIRLTVVTETAPPTTPLPCPQNPTTPPPCPQNACNSFIAPVIIVAIMAIAIICLLIIIAFLLRKIKTISAALAHVKLAATNPMAGNEMLLNSTYHNPDNHSYEMIPQGQSTTSLSRNSAYSQLQQGLSSTNPSTHSEQRQRASIARSEIDGGEASYLTGMNAEPADYEEPLKGSSYERLVRPNQAQQHGQLVRQVTR